MLEKQLPDELLASLMLSGDNGFTELDETKRGLKIVGDLGSVSRVRVALITSPSQESSDAHGMLHCRPTLQHTAPRLYPFMLPPDELTPWGLGTR